jgi:phage host-nuclease inhibitor protein Gam
MAKKTSIMHSWSEVEDALKEMACIDAHCQKADAKRRLQLIETEEEYSTTTAKRLAQRAFLANEIQSFYMAHRKEVEAAGKKSRESQFGVIGIKLGNKVLGLVKGWSWAKVAEAMTNSLAFEDMLTHVPKINKQQVKAASATAEELAAIGCRISQKETFFIETYPDKAVNG